MFRNRKSQKPNEDFYHQFRQTFPNVSPEGIQNSTDNVAGNDQANVSVDAIQSLLHRPSMGGNDDEMKGQDPTPRASTAAQDQWSMTPSVLDTSSVAFTNLASQPSTYYGIPTPTTSNLPSTMSGHTQPSADFATPGMGINLMPPMMNSQPTSVDPCTISNPSITMSALHAPFVSQIGNGINNTFAQQQQSFAPIFNGVSELSIDNAEDATFGNMNIHEPEMEPANDIQNQQEPSEDYSNEDLRFNVLLRAPTAMIKEPDDVPITYLNKGQAYGVTVIDTAPGTSATARPVKYRTFIRISFEEDEQRSKPDSCWVLWQEGRGANEAHHRDGKLLAVEHVDPNQGGNGESRHPQIQLDCANFDGFAVTWTPNRTSGRHECTISVRFNFLSTDFSHSKGVKGIPVRLCHKTEVIATTEGPQRSVPEVAYCKVKLFRDHGAERKLSNDTVHVKKLMDKIRAQITQAEMGSAQGDKRKRSGSISLKNSLKLTKQKRSFSIGQSDSRPSLEDDLNAKLESLLEMLTSAHGVSHLNLRGDPQDDPDMFPVKLETNENVPVSYDWEVSQDTIGVSQAYSPSSSRHSIASRNSDAMRAPIFAYNNSRPGSSRPVSVDWSNFSHQDSDGSKFSQILTNPVQIQRVSGGESEGPFEAMGVDPTYTPPLDATKVPRYCFYVKLYQTPGDAYYHAVYLSQRTAADFIAAISQKWKVDPSHVQRAVLIREDGLSIVVDDDVVREFPEGKDMVAEFTNPRGNSVESMDIDSPSGHEGIEIKIHFDCLSTGKPIEGQHPFHPSSASI